MATIANLVVEIKGRADQLNRTLSQSARRTQAFSREANSSFRNMFQSATRRAQLFGRSVAALGRRFRNMAQTGLASIRSLIGGFSKLAGILTGVVLVAVGLVVRKIVQTANEIDAVAKSARALNISVKAFQELSFAASLAGVNSEKLSASLRFMNRTIGETAMGLGAAGDALSKLGLDAERLQDLNIEDQFKTIAKELRNVSNASERAALASKLFGAEGIFAVNKLIGSVQESRKEFRGLGIALSEEQIAAVEAFNDARTRLLAIWTGFKQQVVAAVAPAFQTILENIQATIMANGGLQSAAQKTANVIISGANTAAKFVKELRAEYKAGLPTLKTLASQAKDTFDTIVDAATAAAKAVNSVSEGYDSIKKATTDLLDPGILEDQQRAAQTLSDLIASGEDPIRRDILARGLPQNVVQELFRQNIHRVRQRSGQPGLSQTTNTSTSPAASIPGIDVTAFSNPAFRVGSRTVASTSSSSTDLKLFSSTLSSAADDFKKTVVESAKEFKINASQFQASTASSIRDRMTQNEATLESARASVAASRRAQQESGQLRPGEMIFQRRLQQILGTTNAGPVSGTDAGKSIEEIFKRQEELINKQLEMDKKQPEFNVKISGDIAPLVKAVSVSDQFNDAVTSTTQRVAENTARSTRR